MFVNVEKTLIVKLCVHTVSPVHFLPRDTKQSAVMPQHVICPSVRPSVCPWRSRTPKYRVE